MKVLVLNGGSSSLKGLLCGCRASRCLGRAAAALGSARRLGPAARRGGCPNHGRHRRGGPATAGDGFARRRARACAAGALEGPARVMAGPGEIDVAGHRIVHGGQALREPTRVTPAVKAAIAGMVEFAPEHNRLELDAIEAVERVLGDGVPQVAVFDTAFHSSLPPAAAVATRGPTTGWTTGIRRYGFHGISHQYVSRRAAETPWPRFGSLRLLPATWATAVRWRPCGTGAASTPPWVLLRSKD